MSNGSTGKVKLSGFNNLTKSLSFNIYDVCYAGSVAQAKKYLEYIDEAYSGRRLGSVLRKVSGIIGAQVMNVSDVDYEPHGASAAMLIAEEGQVDSDGLLKAAPHSSQVLHLDKSHITAHTYPETLPNEGICTFRADIDVSTCGHISPLNALDLLINSFESDVVIIDYRVRGFTRDENGDKHFIDHAIHSIQDFIAPDILRRYQSLDVNSYDENLFHTKMRIREFNLDEYLFEIAADSLPERRREGLARRLRREIDEIHMGG